jgi:TonB family protein
MRRISGGFIVLGLAMVAGSLHAQAPSLPGKGTQTTPDQKKPDATASTPGSVAVEIANQIPPADRDNLKGYWPVVQNKTKQQLVRVMPAAAKPPLSTTGEVKIVAWLHTDGSLTGMTLEHPSGKVALDRAAWAAVAGSMPYDPFPYGIAVDQIKVRFTIGFNGASQADGSKSVPGIVK